MQPQNSRQSSDARPPIVVVAAVLIENGRVLVTCRPDGTHLAGAWEFPGGKVEAGEDPRAALARELREEIGVETEIGDIIEVVFHRYPEKDVLLLFFAARRLATSPEPRALEVAGIDWRAQHELTAADFPPADVAVLEKIRRILSDRSG